MKLINKRGETQGSQVNRIHTLSKCCCFSSLHLGESSRESGTRTFREGVRLHLYLAYGTILLVGKHCQNSSKLNGFMYNIL